VVFGLKYPLYYGGFRPFSLVVVFIKLENEIGNHSKHLPVRICCSSGLGVGLVMTAQSWPWLKRRFAVPFSAEAAVVSNHTIRDTVSESENIAGSTKLELGSAARKEVILVTGGAGFLGQHIVRLLQERASNVAEIRVFDTRPYRNKLGKSRAILNSAI